MFLILVGFMLALDAILAAVTWHFFACVWNNIIREGLRISNGLIWVNLWRIVIPMSNAVIIASLMQVQVLAMGAIFVFTLIMDAFLALVTWLIINNIWAREEPILPFPLWRKDPGNLVWVLGITVAIANAVVIASLLQ